MSWEKANAIWRTKRWNWLLKEVSAHVGSTHKAGQSGEVRLQCPAQFTFRPKVSRFFWIWLNLWKFWCNSLKNFFFSDLSFVMRGCQSTIYREQITGNIVECRYDQSPSICRCSTDLCNSANTYSNFCIILYLFLFNFGLFFCTHSFDSAKFLVFYKF